MKIEEPAVPLASPAPAGDFSRPVHCLLGLPFDAVDMKTALQRVRGAAAARRPCFFSTPNLNFAVACRRDAEFRDSVVDSDLSIADGMPLVWIARFLGIPIRERVPGSGLFEALRAGGGPPLAVYFFGGPEGAAEAACRRLNAAPGGLVCVGFDPAGFGPLEAMSEDWRIARINESGADFLVMAVGAKKGQAWIERNRPALQVPVVGHLGAVVNHVAGTVRRAPPWMQRHGLEWLWRIKEEPALWRRYFDDGRALLRLLLSRVLPWRYFLWRHRPPPAALAAAAVRRAGTDGEAALVLEGAWTEGNLQPLRDCLAGDFLAGRDLRLDLRAVSYVDSAFLGLAMLVHGHQRRQGRRLRIDPLPAPLARIFKYAGAEFLL